MTSEDDRRAPVDLVVSVIVLALLQAASLALTPDRALAIITSPAYNAVFGIGKSLLTLWVLFRIWQLVRRDDGRAQLVLASIAANVVGWAYTEAWNLLPAGHTQWSDDLFLAVRIAGLVALGLALLSWKRIDRWVGWVVLGYVVVVSSSIVIGRLWSPGFSTPVIGWAWLAVLVVLLVGVLRMRGSVGRADNSDSLLKPSGI